MKSLFKTKIDGYGYIHTFLGDDNTGDGTPENPFKSWNRAYLAGFKNFLFTGILAEPANGTYLRGDDISQIADASFIQKFGGYRSLTIVGDSIAGPSNNGARFDYCVVSASKITNINLGNLWGNYNLFLQKTNILVYYENNTHFINNTYLAGLNLSSTHYVIHNENLIVYKELNISSNQNSNCRLKNAVFSTANRFYFDTTELSVQWTNDSRENMVRLKKAYINAGLPQTAADNIFLKDVVGNETCIVINEQIAGGDKPNIFAKYDSQGNVTDPNLNSDKLNEALYAGVNGDCCGCYPAVDSIETCNPVNVDMVTGNDAGMGNLLQKNSDGSITFNPVSQQKWNRLISPVMRLQRGQSLLGGNVSNDNGIATGCYFGKKQHVIDSLVINAGTNLEPDTRYKVLNTNAATPTEAIEYNGIQYVPNQVFVTNNSSGSFSLLNQDSGSYVSKVKGSVFQSIEIIPYDTATQVSSTLKPFSIPLHDEVKLLVYKAGNQYGKEAGKQVLFSDAHINHNVHSYFADYGISNADDEYIELSQNTIDYDTKPALLEFFKVVLNGIKDEKYGFKNI